jgi:hypothetical protein
VADVPSSQLEQRSSRTADPHDEPSAEWGWHGTFPVATQVFGWFAVAACFLMFIGNQQGHVEDVYLALTGIGLILLLVRSLVRRRNAWRR